jgi:hypothetical protein
MRVSQLSLCDLGKGKEEKLENLIHRVFDPAQLDIEIKNRLANLVKPREWFLVPLFLVNEVVERIRNGTITERVCVSTWGRRAWRRPVAAAD